MSITVPLSPEYVLMHLDPPDAEQACDALAAQGVRDLLDGKIDGAPIQGTLAYRVWYALQEAEQRGWSERADADCL